MHNPFHVCDWQLGGKFKPQKDVVQLQQENVYPKDQDDPDNWQSV